MKIFDTYDAYGTDINDQYFFKYYIHIVENIHKISYKLIINFKSYIR